MTPSRAFRILLAVALTAYVFFKSNPAAVARAAAGADPRWLLLAVALVVVDRAVNAYRWLLLLRALTPGSRPALGAIMRIFFTSSFVGNFLPSVGGDVYRAYELSRLGVRGGEAAASVLMDRAVGVLSMVIVAAVALFFVRDLNMAGVTPALLVVTAACAVAAAVVFTERAALLAGRAAERLPSAKLHRIARTVIDAVRRYGTEHATLVSVLFFSLIVQLLRVIQAYCLGRALDVPLPMIMYFGFIPVITLIMQLPITVAGLGTTQLAFEWMFGHAGVPPALTFALSLLFLALGTLGNLPGGLLYAVAPARRAAEPPG